MDEKDAELYLHLGQGNYSGSGSDGTSSEPNPGTTAVPMLLRELTDHIVPGDSVNHQLMVQVVDGPGPSGASHEYQIKGPVPDVGRKHIIYRLSFQNGPIKEAGVNGITHEALLAILIDRLRGFQEGKFRCRENAIALTHLEEGLMWLQRRTVERIRRGVEGTHEK